MNEENADFVPKFCKYCGNSLKNPEAQFCGRCGSPIGKAEATPAESKEVVPASSAMEAQPVADKPAYSPPPAFTSPYAGLPTTPSSFTTEKDIKPITDTVFERKEQYIILIVALLGMLAHVFHIMLLFNRYPSIWEVLFALPTYLIIIYLLYFFKKKELMNSGVKAEVTSTRFDYNFSLSMTTFFLTILPTKFSIDPKASSIPETINVQTVRNQQMVYEEMPRSAYITNKVVPKQILNTNMIALIISGGLFLLYLNIDQTDINRSVELATTFRLTAIYISSFVFTELVPVFGRNRKKASSVGKYRSMIFFFLAFVVMLLSLFGERFLSALIDYV